MKNYQTEALAAAVPLPDSVNLAMADIAAAMREGLLAMAVGAGLSVMQALMEESVTTLCGPKGKHDPGRSALRHGREDGSVTLGGRRVGVRHPRVRSADGTTEVPVPAYELFSSTELLGKMAMARMMAKLSTRRYKAGLEPVGSSVEAVATSRSKSVMSRRFVEATEVALAELLDRDLSGLDLVALMVDGVHFAEHLVVVAMGIGMDGTKHPLALAEGSTENARWLPTCSSASVERGLDVTRPVLVFIDGATALSSAVKAVFDHPVIARCQLHKIRKRDLETARGPRPDRGQEDAHRPPQGRPSRPGRARRARPPAVQVPPRSRRSAPGRPRRDPNHPRACHPRESAAHQ